MAQKQIQKNKNKNKKPLCESFRLKLKAFENKAALRLDKLPVS
jgi:hypothetical protein